MIVVAEYIERGALIHSVTSQKVQEMLRGDIADRLSCGRNHADWSNGFECGMQQAINIIANADVVEVVRCKDCKYFVKYKCRADGGMEQMMCSLVNGTYDENWYCADGAKMDGKGEGE